MIISTKKIKIQNSVIISLLIVAILTISARLIALAGIGYQTDDYGKYINDNIISPPIGFLIIMGRFSWWIVHEAILLLGTSPIGASSIFGLIYCLALVYAGYVCCNIWKVNNSPTVVFLIALCISGNHFLGDSFSYRMSYPFMALAIFLSHESIKRNEGGVGKFVFFSIMLAFAIGIYQQVIPIIISILATQWVILLLRPEVSLNTRLLSIRNNTNAFWRIGILFLGTAIYLITNKIVIFIFTDSDKSYSSFISLEKIPNRLLEFAKVLHYDLKCSIPLLPIVAKISFLLCILIVLYLIIQKSINLNYSQNNRFFYPIITSLIFIVSPLSIYILQLISDTGFRESQRVYMTSGWIMAGMLAIISYSSSRTIRFFLVCGLIFGFTGLLVNNRVLSDQARINQRDMLLANRIINRLEGICDVNSLTTIVVFGGWSEYPSKLSTAHWQLNASAVTEPWSKTQFLSEYSGYKFSHPTKSEIENARILVQGMTEWPESGSIIVNGKIGIVNLPKLKGAKEYNHYK
jgi:hypothetical protein